MSEKIFSYEWSDIQRAQQGGRLSRAIGGNPEPKKPVTANELAMFQEIGLRGLVEGGFWGIIDRLGMIEQAKEYEVPRPVITACVDCGENAPESGLHCDECREDAQGD